MGTVGTERDGEYMTVGKISLANLRISIYASELGLVKNCGEAQSRPHSDASGCTRSTGLGMWGENWLQNHCLLILTLNLSDSNVVTGFIRDTP